MSELGRMSDLGVRLTIWNPPKEGPDNGGVRYLQVIPGEGAIELLLWIVGSLDLEPGVLPLDEVTPGTARELAYRLLEAAEDVSRESPFRESSFPELFPEGGLDE